MASWRGGLQSNLHPRTPVSGRMHDGKVLVRAAVYDALPRTLTAQAVRQGGAEAGGAAGASVPGEVTPEQVGR